MQEVEEAKKEIEENPRRIPFWQQIIAGYQISIIKESENAIKLSDELIETYLSTGMFKGKKDLVDKIQTIKDKFNNRMESKVHSRHFSIKDCQEVSLNVSAMEKEPDIQDLILSAHHSYIITLSETPILKIIENHEGKSFVNSAPKKN